MSYFLRNGFCSSVHVEFYYYANIAFLFKLFAWTDLDHISAGCDIVLRDPSKRPHCYLIRPLFGTTEAVVQSYTGIQACWDRRAQSVFCLSLFSLVLSLSLSSDFGVDVHLCWPSLLNLAVEVMVLTMTSVLFLRQRKVIFSFIIPTWYSEHDLRERAQNPTGRNLEQNDRKMHSRCDKVSLD